MLTLFCILFGSNFLYLYDPKAADIGGIMGGILSGILISIGYYDRPENAWYNKLRFIGIVGRKFRYSV